MTTSKRISFGRAFFWGAVFGVVVGVLGNTIIRWNELRFGARYARYEWEWLAVPSELAQALLSSSSADDLQFGEWWSHRYLIVIWNAVVWGIVWLAGRVLWRVIASR